MPEIKVKKDEIEVTDDGKVVITNPDLAKNLKKIKEDPTDTKDEPMAWNVGCNLGNCSAGEVGSLK